MPERARDVEEVVREWLAAKQAGDAAGVSRHLSAYKGALGIGTEADEWWDGADAFASGHLSGGAFRASVASVEAHRHGPVAWAAVSGTIDAGGPEKSAVRLTLVLVEELDGWRVVQSHASVPAAA